VESGTPDDHRTLCVGERYRVNPQQPRQTPIVARKIVGFSLFRAWASMTSTR
jgi:hypothetical protein